MNKSFTRGDIVWVDFDPKRGSEPGKIRPCVIIQNDVGNKFSPVTIVAAIPGLENVPKRYPVDVPVKQSEGGLDKDSVVQCNLIRCVDESRITGKIGRFTSATMAQVDQALKISLALK